MRVRSGHIVFNKSVDYKDLAKVYPEMFDKFLKETNQVPEEEEYQSVLVRSNLNDLEKNRKPEGYNRMGATRLVFPMRDDEKIEFYIYRPAKTTEVARVTENMSQFLKKKGLKHKIEWDQMLMYKNRK